MAMRLNLGTSRLHPWRDAYEMGMKRGLASRRRHKSVASGVDGMRQEHRSSALRPKAGVTQRKRKSIGFGRPKTGLSKFC
jgi:hypothetical protein